MHASSPDAVPANRETAAAKRPELVMTRTFDAPRRLVFAAWTKAEHVARWFTPAPLTTAACEIDARPGGVFRVVMRMPDGADHAFEGRFVEVVEGERLRFAGSIPDGVEVDTTVTFAGEGNQTTITVVQAYSRESDATRGAPMGWKATLDQLGAHVAGMR